MTIQLEAGKFYRTRDNRKVGPARKAAHAHYWVLDLPANTDGAVVAHDYRADGVCALGGAELDAPVCYATHRRDLDAIAEWTEDPPSPVRTVTRTEIVPGTYGRLQVWLGSNLPDEVVLCLVDRRQPPTRTDAGNLNAQELRAAAATLTALADALETSTPKEN